MSDTLDDNGNKQSLPLEYLIMQYRQKFGLTWQEVMDMPVDVFWQDLEMSEIEQSVVSFKQKSHSNK